MFSYGLTPAEQKCFLVQLKELRGNAFLNGLLPLLHGNLVKVTGKSSHEHDVHTFATRGREYKVETTDHHEPGDKVGLLFGPDDIHVMHKEEGAV